MDKGVEPGMVPAVIGGDGVVARLGSLESLGFRMLFVSLVVAECLSIVVLIAPSEGTTTSFEVVIAWNVILVGFLVAWRWVSDRVRRWFLYCVMTVMLGRWTAAWLATEWYDATVAVVATVIQLPTALMSFSMVHRRRVGLIGSGGWLVVLSAIAIVGSRREELRPYPLHDWRIGLLMLGMFGGVVYLLGWWAKERDEFLSASRRELGLLDAAHRDALTGLLNRRAIDACLASLASVAGESVVVLIDIDHFKSVNDSLGHDRGDEVLRGAAAALSGATRRDDVVGRWGGEEFVVICDRPVGLPLTELVERMRAAIGAAGLGVTASAGASVWSRADETWREAMVRADGALYSAKTDGRDRAVVA